MLSKTASDEGPMSNTTEAREEEIDATNVPIDMPTSTKQAAKRKSTDAAPEQDGTRHEIFRLFTFLLDKNGQLNYNIDITEPKAWII